MMIRLQITQYRRRMANLIYAFGLTSLALALAFSLTGAVRAAPSALTAPGLDQAVSLSVLGIAGATNTEPSVSEDSGAVAEEDGVSADSPFLIPMTGAGGPATSALAFRQFLQIGLVVVGMGLMLIGYALRRE